MLDMAVCRCTRNCPSWTGYTLSCPVSQQQKSGSMLWCIKTKLTSGRRRPHPILYASKFSSLSPKTRFFHYTDVFVPGDGVINDAICFKTYSSSSHRKKFSLSSPYFPSLQMLESANEAKKGEKQLEASMTISRSHHPSIVFEKYIRLWPVQSTWFYCITE